MKNILLNTNTTNLNFIYKNERDLECDLEEQEFAYFNENFETSETSDLLGDSHNLNWQTKENLEREQEIFDDIFLSTSYSEHILTFDDISYKYNSSFNYKLIEKSNNIKKFYLSQNLNLDLITQIKLINLKDRKIFFNLLNNPCFDVEVLKNVPYRKIKSLDFFSKQKLVKNEKIHPTMIEKILNDEQCVFLYKTASNNKSFSKEKRSFFGRESKRLMKK